MAKEELNQENTEEVEQSTEEEQTEKTYTQAELEALLQSEADRRISSARKKWEADKEVEAEKLKEEASMTAEEKARAEFEKEKAEWEKEKQAHAREQLLFNTTKKLAEENLPSNFADFVLGTDEETTDSNIQEFKEEWKQAIEKAVDERISGATPRSGNKKPTATVTKEEFKKMSYTDRMKIHDENPDLYAQLTK